jgi:flavin-dependent dehydrogenase
MKKKIFQDEYDAVIVGAGPAGCSAARFLSPKYDVLMIDRLKFPRKKPCGGLLVEESQEFIKKFYQVLPKDIFSKPKYLGLKMIDWDNNLEKDFKRNLWNVSREKFDNWLLKQTPKGVCFFSETNFSHFKKEKESVKVFLEKDNKRISVSTRYLIFANGVFSKSERARLLSKNHIKYYIAVQHWMKYNAKSKKTGKNTWFIYDSEITDFYSWLIPKGGRVIVGSALPDNEKKIDNKMKILRNKLEEKIGLNLNSKVFKKEAYFLSKPDSEKSIFFGDDKIIFIGEAAGLISPSTSEGISFALRSGYNCAKAINENFDDAVSLYKKLSKNLIKEIKEKTKKSNILFNSKERKNFLV